MVGKAVLDGGALVGLIGAMRLDEYLEREGLTRAAMAERLGITAGRLSQLRNAEWPVSLALRLERETGGEVRAETVCALVQQIRARA